MKLPGDLSGGKLADALGRGGSYRLGRLIVETETPSHQRIAIPAHRFLKIGTLHAIRKLVATHQGVFKDDIAKTIA